MIEGLATNYLGRDVLLLQENGLTRPVNLA
jgi:hypothetical protein